MSASAEYAAEYAAEQAAAAAFDAVRDATNAEQAALRSAWFTHLRAEEDQEEVDRLAAKEQAKTLEAALHVRVMELEKALSDVRDRINNIIIGDLDEIHNELEQNKEYISYYDTEIIRIIDNALGTGGAK